jgi:DNA topoisomerase-1
MAKKLVIVESPTKAQTLGKFLGNQYQVEASYGHVRDPRVGQPGPRKSARKVEDGSASTPGDFKPCYVVPDDKRQRVQQLKTALKTASA